MEAERINLLNNTLADLEKRSGEIRVYLDYDGKKDRLEEVVGLSEDPELWNDPKRSTTAPAASTTTACSSIWRWKRAMKTALPRLRKT